MIVGATALSLASPYLISRPMKERKTLEITEELASRILNLVDAGLDDIPRDNTPTAAHCDPHVCWVDNMPTCSSVTSVSVPVRRVMEKLKDAPWSSEEARTKYLRRLAIAQLGTAFKFNEQRFASFGCWMLLLS